MSAPLEVWQQVERRVKRRIASRKLRHARFWKLQGAEAKKAVIDGVVARLMEPDAVLPNPLRMRLAPRPLRAKGAPAGWLGYWRPISSTLWEAWLTVHHQYIEHGDFFYEKNEAVDALIDAAIDTERKSYCEATADSGGPKHGKLDPELSETVSRLAGQALPEQQERVGDFVTALEQRVQEAEEEFSKLKPALNEYSRMLRCPKQRRAFVLICNEPQLTGAKIAVRCHVSEGTVSKLRSKFEEMTEKFFALHTPPEEGSGRGTAYRRAAR
jgi:hypothetical protein